MDCWQVWGGAFTPKSPFEVPKTNVFMLRGPRIKTLPSCSLGSMSTTWTMQAISCEALPLTAIPKGVTKWVLFMLKGSMLNAVSYRTLGFPEYGMANASNHKRGPTPDSNPKMGNTKMRKKIDINLCNSANAKRTVP